jgi:uncharacterized protein with PIN domain
MIVVDSSAIIAILFEERQGPACTAALEVASARVISAANYVETCTVLAGRLPKGEQTKAMEVLDDFLAVLRVEVAPLESATARAALSARLTSAKDSVRAAGSISGTASPTRSPNNIPRRSCMWAMILRRPALSRP